MRSQSKLMFMKDIKTECPSVETVYYQMSVYFCIEMAIWMDLWNHTLSNRLSFSTRCQSSWTTVIWVGIFLQAKNYAHRQVSMLSVTACFLSSCAIRITIDFCNIENLEIRYNHTSWHLIHSTTSYDTHVLTHTSWQDYISHGTFSMSWYEEASPKETLTGILRILFWNWSSVVRDQICSLETKVMSKKKNTKW